MCCHGYLHQSPWRETLRKHSTANSSVFLNYSLVCKMLSAAVLDCSSQGQVSTLFCLHSNKHCKKKRKKKAVKTPKPLKPLSNVHCQGDLGCNPYKPLNPAPHLSYQGNFGRLQTKRQGHISSSCSCQSTEQLQKSELRFRRKVSLSGLCIFPGSQIVT